VGKYQICNRCIMDTSDPEITFDEKGNCNHCKSAIDQARKIWFPDEHGEKIIDEIIKKIISQERKKEFDCIIGLSGGVDSSYLAYYAVKHGLRPLVVHVDCGWTFVVNWEEMKDLQRAFFKASLPDQDIPQDHAIFAALYNFAEKNNIRYVLNGLNFATECIMPENWGYQAMDYWHLRSIHKKFGAKKLKDYPHVNFFMRYIYYPYLRRMKIINPLNYIDYRKDDAIKTMQMELGWQYYGGKHHESRFTKFFQSYYLPYKFNFDKRRAHLSSLIVSRQISREDALSKMDEEIYHGNEVGNDLEYVAKKLDWSPQEFRAIIDLPPNRHQDFPTNERLFRVGLRSKEYLKNIFR
jgi:N-acetyl sugar amidotransferase